VRHIARLLLAALLLAAQQAALEHALWHAGTAQAASGEPQKSGSGRSNPLCDQHAALGAVAGAIGCAHALAARPTPEIAAVAAVVLPAHGNAPLTPSCRDPPALL
jgi:hypothetical protein